jgi:hypothetical protein
MIAKIVVLRVAIISHSKLPYNNACHFRLSLYQYQGISEMDHGIPDLHLLLLFYKRNL